MFYIVRAVYSGEHKDHDITLVKKNLFLLPKPEFLNVTRTLKKPSDGSLYWITILGIPTLMSFPHIAIDERCL